MPKGTSGGFSPFFIGKLEFFSYFGGQFKTGKIGPIWTAFSQNGNFPYEKCGPRIAPFWAYFPYLRHFAEF